MTTKLEDSINNIETQIRDLRAQLHDIRIKINGLPEKILAMQEAKEWMDFPWPKWAIKSIKISFICLAALLIYTFGRVSAG